LKGSKLNVVDAYWCYDEEAYRWYLFLVSPFVEEHGSMPAYAVVQEAMGNAPCYTHNEDRVDLLDVKVVAPGRPVAAGVADYIETYRPSYVTHFDRTSLNGRYIRDMYIYPRTFVQEAGQ